MKSVFIYCCIILITTNFSILSQHNNLQKSFNSNSKINTQSNVLNEIETGIIKNDLKSIAKYFSPQPYISLINGVNGYYSQNQAYYILEDFFNSYKVVQFKFEEKKIEGSVSFGKGTYYYEMKGKREKAHLYITLSKSGGEWYFTQISIN